MPEGPSLFKWCTMAKQFLGRKITRISGSSKTVDKMKWSGASLAEVRVYGKRLFLNLVHRRGSTSSASDEESVWIRCHFLMWGSVRVNEFNCKPSKTNRFPEPRIVFYFSKDEFLVFYGGSFKEMDQPPEDESRSDILSDAFDRSKAVDHVLEDLPISFTLLDQRKFTGLGNIIKNEVLFSTGTHPMQIGSQLSRAKATGIVDTVVTFSKRWLSWKMEEKPSIKFGDWTEIYKKAMCPCDHKTTRSMFGPTGMERITYWCSTCQPMNNHDDPPLEESDGTPTPDQAPEAVNEFTLKGISQTIPESEHQKATADESGMAKSLEGALQMPLRAVKGVRDFKQEETPVNSNQELKSVQNFPMMQESHSAGVSHCGPKPEQTPVDPTRHQTEMNDASLSILPLQTELNCSVASHTENENASPLTLKQTRQRLHATKKTKHVSEATSNFDLSEEEACENVSQSLPTTMTPSCNVKSIGVQRRVEDSTRISVSVSTINVLMRSHVRVNVKKLKLDED